MADFRDIILTCTDGSLATPEPIKQPLEDGVFHHATFRGRLFQSVAIWPDRAEYEEIPALRCGSAVIHDGQIEGVGVGDIVKALND